MTKALQLLTLFLWFLIPDPVSAQLHEVHEVHYQMGTFLEFTIWHSDAEFARNLMRAAVQDVHRLDETFSNFAPESAISRLNRQAGKGTVSLPSKLYDLLKMAGEFSAKTSGYFDVTVGPLVGLWHESLSKGVLPARDRWAEAKQKVGYEKINLYAPRTAELLVPGMEIDLGGIGKGYAVDRIAKQFEISGIKSALINFGSSSMFAIGSPSGKLGWEIGIQGMRDEVQDVICLHDMALSTSSSLGKLWTVRGKNNGHIIDPKTGLPVFVSRTATVIAPSATAAEALTKPMVLLGSKAFSMLRNFPQSEAVIFSRHGVSRSLKRLHSEALCGEVSGT